MLLYKSRHIKTAISAIKFDTTATTLHNRESSSVYFNVTPSTADVSSINFTFDKANCIVIDDLNPTSTQGQYKLDFHAISDHANYSIATDNWYGRYSNLSVVLTATSRNVTGDKIITILPSGTPQTAKLFYNEFFVIGKNKDGTNIVTLMDGSNNGSSTYESADEDGALWRTAYTTFMNNYFSNTLSNALQSVNKVSVKSISSSGTVTQNISSKIHLLSTSELGMDSSEHSYFNVQNLGNIDYGLTYQQIRNSTIGFDQMLLRSKGYYQDIEKNVVFREDTIDKKKDYTVANYEYTKNLHPIMFLQGDLRVKFIKTYLGITYYYIDWTGTSSLKLKDINNMDCVYDINGEVV